jgi:hypothetical protein
MIDQVKKVFEQLERLPTKKQEEIASLIQDELNWDITFEQTQEQLSSLAREATQEYDAGNTSDKDW